MMGLRGWIVTATLAGAVLWTLASPCLAEEKSSDWNWFKKHISAESRTVFRFRSAEEEEDLDYYNYWIIQGRDLMDGKLDAYFSARSHKDLDGVSRNFAKDPLTSIEDRDDEWDSQIYQLYGDIHDPARTWGLRLGRQYIDQADWLHVDGADLRILQKENIRLQGFVGRPVSFYSATEGDFAGGFSVEGRFSPFSRVRFGYVHYEDDSLDQNDDRFILDAWHRVNEQLQTHGRLSILEEEVQTAGIDVAYFNKEGTFDAFFEIRYWGGQEEGTLEYSPLYSILGELEPYTFVAGRLTLQINPWISISPGASGRFVDASDRDNRNRQYGNFDLTVILQPVKHWTASVSGQYWDVNGDDRFWGLSGEVEYRPNKIWRVSAGTAYLDYEYNQISDFGYSYDNGDIQGSYDGVTNYTTQISPDAYTYFAKANVRLSDSVSVRVEGEIEDNSLEDDLFYGLRTSLSLSF